MKKMEKTRISIVSYLNSKPFLYGIEHSDMLDKIDLSPDIPSKVASKLAYNQADIGLIPVAGLRDLDEYHLVSNFCIGSLGKVKTVVLVSEVPLEEVEVILMDYQSRSSVLLAKVLAHFYWKKQVKWENTCADFHNKSIKGNTAGVLIGDRVFNVEGRFKYCYDLSEEWYKFTGLPFVFAVWASNKKIPHSIENEFNSALELGLKNIDKLVESEAVHYPGVDIQGYFQNNITFTLDDEKRKGMKKFLELAQKLEPVELT